MKTPACITVCALLVLPAFASPPEKVQSAAATQPDTAKPTFDLKAVGVQAAIRAAAASEPDPIKPDTAEPATAGKDLLSLTFRAPRRAHHMNCDSFVCVAYSADGDALFTIPRDQTSRVTDVGDNGRNEWLSCQSGNDLLTTFERYDKCRGVTIGLPARSHDSLLDVPDLTL
jgi:hypothetical protein